MKTKMILLTVAEGWKPGFCTKCVAQKYCSAYNGDEIGVSCPLSDAEEAVEINPICMTDYTLDGKPVKLYAVKGED